MNAELKCWQKRRKRPVRRIANDLRLLAPIIGIALCFAGSATTIFATERAPLPLIQEELGESTRSPATQDACPSTSTSTSSAPEKTRLDANEIFTGGRSQIPA